MNDENYLSIKFGRARSALLEPGNIFYVASHRSANFQTAIQLLQLSSLPITLRYSQLTLSKYLAYSQDVTPRPTGTAT